MFVSSPVILAEHTHPSCVWKPRLLHFHDLTAITVHPSVCANGITHPSWNHTAARIVCFPEKWEIFTIPALILVCLLNDTDALQGVFLLTLRASSTKRWHGYQRRARHICIVILIIWFSSGYYCVLFYKSGYKILTFTPAVPRARFSRLPMQTDPLELIACAFFCFFLPEALSSRRASQGDVTGGPPHFQFLTTGGKWVSALV